MVFTVLDIGAGSCAFAKDFARANHSVPMAIFCGEPAWGLGPFFRPISLKKRDRILNRKSTGVWRVVSAYAKFQLPDESLDLVTLNAPHPFMGFGMTSRMVPELARCIKPGGLFFSSYPRTDSGFVPRNFELLSEDHWYKLDEEVIFQKLPEPNRFPQSPTVSHNMRVHRYGDPLARGTAYTYYSGISPGYRLWRKPQ